MIRLHLKKQICMEGGCMLGNIILGVCIVALCIGVVYGIYMAYWGGVKATLVLCVVGFQNHCSFFSFGEDRECRTYDFVDIVESQSAVDPTKNFVAQTVGNGFLKGFKIHSKVVRKRNVTMSYSTQPHVSQKFMFNILHLKDWA